MEQALEQQPFPPLNVRERYLQSLGYRPLRFSEQGLSEHFLQTLPRTDPRLSPCNSPNSSANRSKSPDSPLVRLTNHLVAPGSVASSVFNLCCATLGAGALSLPFAFRNAGILLGTLFLAAGCLLTIYSIRLLLYCRTKARLSSYEDLAMYCFGPWGALFVEANIVLFCFGTCIAYIVALADILHPVVLLLTSSFVSSRPFIIAALVLSLIFPLSLVEKISSLSFVSLLGILSITYLVLAISCTSAADMIEHGSPHLSTPQLANMSTNIFLSIPIIMFAFTCQVNVFSIYTELNRPCIRRMHKVVDRSSMVTFALYLLVGVFGYLQNLDDTNADILYNYSIQQPQIALAQLAVGLSLVFAFPMNVYPCRSTLELMFFAQKPASPVRTVLLTAAVVFASSGLAMLIPGIDAVFTLIGAICSSIVCFVLPGAFYCQLEEGSVLSSHKIGPFSLAVGGALIGLVSAYFSVQSLL